MARVLKSILIEEELWNELRKISVERGVSISRLIEEAIRNFLQPKTEKKDTEKSNVKVKIIEDYKEIPFYVGRPTWIEDGYHQLKCHICGKVFEGNVQSEVVPRLEQHYLVEHKMRVRLVPKLVDV